MKILFLQQWIGNTTDANSNISSVISSALAKKGHTMYCMGESYDGNPLSENCFPIYSKLLSKTRASYSAIDKETYFAKKLIAALKYPPAIVVGLARRMMGFNLWAYLLRKNLEKQFNEVGFDMVVAFTAPYYTVMALASSNITATKILYMLDPYATNMNFNEPDALNKEIASLKGVNHAFVTPLIYEEYKHHTILQNFIQKCTIAEFPFNIEEELSSTNLENEYFDPDKINLVFMGYLYPDIRSPEVLFRLLNTLAGKRIKLSIWGGFYGRFPEGYLEKWSEILGDSFQLYPPVSHDRALSIMRQADVLVNLGNTISNQMPSKVMEYIATGKPILNLYQIKECPTLAYLQKHEYALSLNINKEPNLDQIKSVTQFCIASKGKQMPLEAIKRIYSKSSPGYIATQLEQAYTACEELKTSETS